PGPALRGRTARTKLWGGRPRLRRPAWSACSHAQAGRPGGRPRARGSAPQTGRARKRLQSVVVQMGIGMTDKEAKAALTDCRSRIDVVDRRIVALLNERTRIVEEIGRVKRKMQMPIYEPKREDEVFANAMAANPGPLSPEAVKRIFERIIDEMRVIQKHKM